MSAPSRALRCPRAAGLLALLPLLVLLGACAMGPRYAVPSAASEDAYKEELAGSGWKPAQPADLAASGDTWWQIFASPELASLEERIEPSNQTLAVAQAQLAQSRALIRESRAGLFPNLTLGLGVTRVQRSATLGSGSSSGLLSSGASGLTRTYSLPLDLSWELDLWGRVRRAVEANRANADASAADLRATRLSLQAELALDYFQLRSLDAEKQLLDDTVAGYERSLQLARNRYAAGVVAQTDVVQAQTQLETTQAQAIDLGVQRAQLEHAIAVLTGQAAAALSLPVSPLAGEPPVIPAGVPSELLERRPDIAAAERRVAAANAQVGVAVAGFFPSFTLSASGGFESATFANWFNVPSRVWSLGPLLSQTVFDGGRLRALRDEARAAFDATVATYRASVLTAFQEVEDQLAAQRILADESRVQADAVRSSDRSVELILNQYKAGTVSYTDVITAQVVALANHRAAVELQNRRMAASVLLVKALGGAWGP